MAQLTTTTTMTTTKSWSMQSSSSSSSSLFLILSLAVAVSSFSYHANGFTLIHHHHHHHHHHHPHHHHQHLKHSTTTISSSSSPPSLSFHRFKSSTTQRFSSSSFSSIIAATRDTAKFNLKKKMLYSYSSSSSSSLSMTTADDQQQQPITTGLAADEKDFTMGYLNKHHSDALLSLVLVFSHLGTNQVEKNAFSGGSYIVKRATIVDISSSTTGSSDGDLFLKFDAMVKIRGKEEEQMETVTISLDANPVPRKAREFKTLPHLPPSLLSSLPPLPLFIRRLNRLLLICHHPKVTGKLIQLGFQFSSSSSSSGDDDDDKKPMGHLPPNLYLNQVPHNRYIRQYFYALSARALLQSVVYCSQKKISHRMIATMLFPELNPSMDAYRIGTLLELTRTIAITLAEQNLRVKVCVQDSMGVGIFTGLPKQLGGVMTLLRRMDWQSGEGEENEGMIGEYVTFGHVGKEWVVDNHVNEEGKEVKQDDVFLILCPQSMIGIESSIIGPLKEMTEAAGDRPVILINPDLSDKRSSQGQQSVRGRQDRLDFINTFETVCHFQCLYVSGTSYFPIVGALGKNGPMEPWVAYQRRDLRGEEGEVYVPVVSGEERMEGEVIMNAFEM